jgi:signal transduction histidine kinase
MISAAADAHIAQSNAPINVARLTALSPLAQWVYELGWACAHNNSFWGPSAALLSRLFQEVLSSIYQLRNFVRSSWLVVLSSVRFLIKLIWLWTRYRSFVRFFLRRWDRMCNFSLSDGLSGEELAAQDATRTKDARANLVALAKELRVCLISFIVFAGVEFQLVCVLQRRDLLPVERARSRFAGEFLVAMGDVRDLTEGYRKLVNRIVTAHRLALLSVCPVASNCFLIILLLSVCRKPSTTCSARRARASPS